MAERAVQTVKWLLEKCEDPYLSILEYRTIPHRIMFVTWRVINK